MPQKRKEDIDKSNRKAREDTIERLKSKGHDLVIISSTPTGCLMCDPWVGKVFSISGKDHEYPPLSKAIAGGLFHDGCRHVVSLAPAAKDRYLERLQNPETRDAEIKRLAAKHNKEHPKKEAHGLRKWLGF